MKTPKEIIDKYFPSGLHEDPEQSELNKIFIFNAMEEYASQFKSQSDNPTQMSNTKEWTTPNENDEIDVPDELMPLFNQIGTQVRLHTISGKNEVLTIAHCVRNAQKFFQSRISELEAENKRLREVLEKVNHAIYSSNMRGTILHLEVRNALNPQPPKEQ